MAKSGTPRHSKRAPAATIEHEPGVSPTTLVEADQLVEKAEEEITFEPAETATDPAETAEAASQTTSAAQDTYRPSPPQAAGRGLNLLSGLAGGALALLGAASLQWAGVLPSLGNDSDLAVLKQQVSTLQEAPAPQTADPAVIEGLKTAQTGLQSTIESISTELTTVSAATRKMADELKVIKQSGAAGDTAAVSALNEKLAALETQIGNIKPADNSAQIAALEEKITSLGGAGGAANVAQAIAAAGLKAAIDRGGSFANELETYATVAPQSPELEQLKGLASAGVPSKSELAASFSNAANAMIAASQVSDPNAGIFDRLASSAKSMIRSRPVGAVEGDSVEAVVARMEVAINRGDLDAAVLESAKLPDEARAAGAEFLNHLTARRDTDALVTRALTSALGAAGAAK